MEKNIPLELRGEKKEKREEKIADWALNPQWAGKPPEASRLRARVRALV